MVIIILLCQKEVEMGDKGGKKDKQKADKQKQKKNDQKTQKKADSGKERKIFAK